MAIHRPAVPAEPARESPGAADAASPQDRGRQRDRLASAPRRHRAVRARRHRELPGAPADFLRGPPAGGRAAHPAPAARHLGARRVHQRKARARLPDAALPSRPAHVARLSRHARDRRHHVPHPPRCARDPEHRDRRGDPVHRGGGDVRQHGLRDDTDRLAHRHDRPRYLAWPGHRRTALPPTPAPAVPSAEEARQPRARHHPGDPRRAPRRQSVRTRRARGRALRPTLSRGDAREAAARRP